MFCLNSVPDSPWDGWQCSQQSRLQMPLLLLMPTFTHTSGKNTRFIRPLTPAKINHNQNVRSPRAPIKRLLVPCQVLLQTESSLLTAEDVCLVAFVFHMHWRCSNVSQMSPVWLLWARHRTPHGYGEKQARPILHLSSLRALGTDPNF